MKHRFHLFLLLFLGSHLSFAQITTTDLQQVHNTAKFTGSEDELLRLLGKNLRYPVAAQKSGEVGVVLGVVKVSREGKIVATGSLNKAGASLQHEFERVAKLLEGKLAATNDTASFFYMVIPVEYTLVGKGYTADLSTKPAYFLEPVTITGYSNPPAKYEPVSEQEQAYVEKVNELIQKKKYDKAIQTLEHLVNLQPLFVPYYQNLVTLNKKVGNTNQAAYYKWLLQVIGG